ncbi:MAG TPA: hypothetical protein VMV41_00735 [Cellulomonadaceae bacterium]|nr:hypothetical protein [Cellulomonadaceae bacterium]
MNPEVSNDVIATRLEALTAEVGHLREDLNKHSETYVRRSEWDLRAVAADREIVLLRADIVAVKSAAERREDLATTTSAQRHVPWTAIVAVVVAIAAVLFDVIPRIH